MDIYDNHLTTNYYCSTVNNLAEDEETLRGVVMFMRFANLAISIAIVVQAVSRDIVDS